MTRTERDYNFRVFRTELLLLDKDIKIQTAMISNYHKHNLIIIVV